MTYELRTGQNPVGVYNLLFEARQMGHSLIKNGVINEYEILTVDGVVIWTDKDDNAYN